MSELHVRQIRAALNQQFRQLIDLSDVDRHPPDQQDKDFFSRAQLAFVLAHLASITADEAARAITDGSGDNGIDGVLYRATERVLYIGQSKWRNDGAGSIERGDMLKFIKGFRDLINARWSCLASIMASATPFYFCAMQKHLTFERTRRSRT